MFKRFLALSALLGAMALVVATVAVSAGPTPSGQRMYGNASFSLANPADPTSGSFSGGGGTIEPAYDDATGTLVYLQTPNGPPVHPPKKIDPSTGMPINVAPIYLPMYPVGSGIDPATLNCAHVPADNCPDHGPLLAAVAASIMPNVYGGGVVGHDHLVGIASTGGDFNILWEPVLVLFTNPGAATTHITTLAQINNAVANHDAIEVPIPPATFHCSSVSAAAYWRGTPSPTVTGP
ncbi:MAG TPA: hypothetical protein VJQ07_12815 [Gaiellaceae bacterium]|jgi:hypothetical protein|nr:hypothetical protein [Gaiellaceae bacterium]